MCILLKQLRCTFTGCGCFAWVPHQTCPFSTLWQLLSGHVRSIMNRHLTATQSNLPIPHHAYLILCPWLTDLCQLFGLSCLLCFAVLGVNMKALPPHRRSSLFYTTQCREGCQEIDMVCAPWLSGEEAGGRRWQQAGLQPAHAVPGSGVRAHGAAGVWPAAGAVRRLQHGLPHPAVPLLRPCHGGPAADPHPGRRHQTESEYALAVDCTLYLLAREQYHMQTMTTPLSAMLRTTVGLLIITIMTSFPGRA